ncbi:MAG: polymer-forming cytoskeletal protein [Candidatus Doudnabacteria bacterium]|nr:polymer-forming cytoskeletal protein [Candidatus Doudnabacteria bacterium]
MAARNENPDTIVATSMRIEGELKSGGNIKIDGVISGKVQTSADLVIGSNAQIDADLIAASAVIAGVVKGNVTIKNSLTIMETGKIIGNIACSSLSIREGAYFSGNCRMQEPKQGNHIAPEPEE